jgi:hypothetical protein
MLAIIFVVILFTLVAVYLAISNTRIQTAVEATTKASHASLKNALCLSVEATKITDPILAHSKTCSAIAIVDTLIDVLGGISNANTVLDVDIAPIREGILNQKQQLFSLAGLTDDYPLRDSW